MKAGSNLIYQTDPDLGWDISPCFLLIHRFMDCPYRTAAASVEILSWGRLDGLPLSNSQLRPQLLAHNTTQ